MKKWMTFVIQVAIVIGMVDVGLAAGIADGPT
jgi:hypothetical protein